MENCVPVPELPVPGVLSGKATGIVRPDEQVVGCFPTVCAKTPVPRPGQCRSVQTFVSDDVTVEFGKHRDALPCFGGLHPATDDFR